MISARAKILAVDDDENLRELISDTLEGAGYNVITAADGREALKKVYDESPDVMVLDVTMPYLTGYEVCEKIRNDILMRNLPIIMLTVKSSEKDEVTGLKLGVDDYIKKPFRPAVLLARIKSALQRSQQGVSVNPLTYLPGNATIMREFELRLKKGSFFSVLFVDLDNFKAFNDYYGFNKGDEIIKETARLLIKAVQEADPERGFVGHIGGDDFIAVSENPDIKTLCRKIIKDFDSMVINYYDEEVKNRGYIITENRKGVKEKFPLMTISIGVVSSVNKSFSHVGELSKRGSEVKNYAKKTDKSNFVIDRRSS